MRDNKILLIFDPANQKHLVASILYQMRLKGIQIDSFNSYEWVYVSTDKDIPLFFRLLRPFLLKPKLDGLIRRLFQTLLLLYVSKPYDLVDIHFFWRGYVPFVKALKKPYKITIWGSDFYREKNEIQEIKKALYAKAVLIQVETEEVKSDVVSYYPALNSKIEVCNFGVDILDKIDELRYRYPILKEKVENRIVITCGYNASEGQRHGVLLSIIASLPAKMKQHICICVPATYGMTPSYEEKLKRELEQVNVPYKLFDKRLSEEGLALLRICSDIVLNIQITDTLNSSLIQHLYAGGILLVGEWLKYGIYDRNNIYYHKVSLENLREMIISCIENFEKERDLALRNRERVKKFASWDSLSNKQFEIYKKILMN